MTQGFYDRYRIGIGIGIGTGIGTGIGIGIGIGIGTGTVGKQEELIWIIWILKGHWVGNRSSSYRFLGEGSEKGNNITIYILNFDINLLFLYKM